MSERLINQPECLSVKLNHPQLIENENGKQFHRSLINLLNLSTKI